VAIALGLASCYPPRITELPHGTFDIDPTSISPDLHTDAMTATVTDDTVTFRYTPTDGDPVEVVYQIDPEQ